jgi:hypothetical protein
MALGVKEGLNAATRFSVIGSRYSVNRRLPSAVYRSETHKGAARSAAPFARIASDFQTRTVF